MKYVIMSSRPNSVGRIKDKFERQIESEGVDHTGIIKYGSVASLQK